MALTRDGVIKKLNGELRKIFLPGDLADPKSGTHVVDYFVALDRVAWVQSMQDLRGRLQTLGWMQEPEVTHVPQPTAAVDFMANITMLNLNLVRGKPKVVNVIETVRNFLDQKFESLRSPLVVVPDTGLGQPVGTGTWTVSVGMTRALACRLICSLAEQHLADEELQLLKAEVSACFQFKCVMEVPVPAEELVAKSIRAKFVVSESTRPDILQLYSGLQASFATQGLVYQDAIAAFVADFNAKSSVETARLSEGEVKMLMLLPCQEAQFLQALSAHWDQFKKEDSAVTMRVLLGQVSRTKAKDSRVPLVWQTIFAPSARKNTYFILRQIAVFVQAVQQASSTLRKGQSLNLRVRAARFRDQCPEIGYDIVCCWAHWEQDFRTALGGKYDETFNKFLAGAFDKEFTEKVKTQDGGLLLEDWRFLSILQGTDTTVRSLEVKQAEADQAAERAKYAAWQAAVLKEQQLFQEYCGKVRAHEAKRQADERAFRLEDAACFDKACAQYMEAWVPVLGPIAPEFVNAQSRKLLNEFAVRQGVQPDGVVSLLLADLTKLGSAFSKHLTNVTKFVADHVQADPLNAAALVFPPNTGCWGSTFNEAEVEKAIGDVESALKMEQGSLVVRKITLTLAESCLATQSRRCGFHEAFFCISSVKGAEGELLSHWVKSVTYYRRTIPDVPVAAHADYVVPDLSAINGCTSISQRLKQALSGDAFYLKILSKLRTGLPPKDLSLIKARTLSSLEPHANPTMVASLIWARDDSGADRRVQLLEWLNAKFKRTLQDLVKERPDILEEYGYKPSTLEVTSLPSYKDADFIWTIPVVEEGKHFLPMRADKLQDLKMSLNVCQEMMAAAVVQHNQKFNPAGHAWTPAKKRTAEIAELDQGEALNLSPSGKVEDLPQPVITILPDGATTFKILLDNKRQVWLQATSDGEVSVHQPLMLAWGSYVTGADVEARDKAKASLLPMAFQSASDGRAFCFHEDLEKLKPPFVGKCCSIKEFLEYLEGKGVVKPFFVSHELKVQDGDPKFALRSTEPCSFEKKDVPANQQACYQNALSMMDLKALQSEQTVNVFVQHRLKFLDNKQQTGIYPQKPGLFLKKRLLIASGQLYRLV
ncbi:unnamed protein product [Symbiodinium microadriaticum]|nr:unnamed protein product [Symbiodinium microadriaticum]